MADVSKSSAGVPPEDVTGAVRPAHQAYQVLHWGFTAIPTLAGLDKFFHVMTDWDQYLAPQIARLLPFSVHRAMLVVGVLEILAGLIVALRPRIGGYIVGTWFAWLILNAFLRGAYYDVALRDFGLMLGALALARLATLYEHKPGRPLQPT